MLNITIIIITDEYDLGGAVALLLQDHLTLLIVSHVTTNQSTTPKQSRMPSKCHLPTNGFKVMTSARDTNESSTVVGRLSN